MAEPMGFDPFAAAAATDQWSTEPADDLRRLAADDAERRLGRRLDDLAERVDRMREQEGDDDLTEVLPLLEAAAGAPDAPLEWRSMHGRVRTGTLTWPQVWHAPEEQPGGLALVAAVARQLARQPPSPPAPPP